MTEEPRVIVGELGRIEVVDIDGPSANVCSTFKKRGDEPAPGIVPGLRAVCIHRRHGARPQAGTQAVPACRCCEEMSVIRRLIAWLSSALCDLACPSADGRQRGGDASYPAPRLAQFERVTAAPGLEPARQLAGRPRPKNRLSIGARFA